MKLLVTRSPELRRSMRRAWFRMFLVGPVLLLLFKLLGLFDTPTQWASGATLALCLTIAFAAHYVVLCMTGEG